MCSIKGVIMGFWSRLTGEVEKNPRVKVAVIGEGAERDRLVQAYSRREDVELIAVSSSSSSEEVIHSPGLAAVELVVPSRERFGLACNFIGAGVMTSLDVPATAADLDKLSALGRAYNVPVRYRLLPLYYPPYREIKRILNEDWLGLPISLKLAARRGKGTTYPAEIEPVSWFRENELGFLALAQWLMGPVEKVYSRLMPCTPEKPVSQAITWKYRKPQQYGYFHLDFCPGLHVRTFGEPVHRAIELTCAGGVIMATRGEAQMLRTPALLVRGKSTATALEMVPDEWEDVYSGLAAETVEIIKQKRKKLIGSEKPVHQALSLVSSAEQSYKSNSESWCTSSTRI